MKEALGCFACGGGFLNREVVSEMDLLAFVRNAGLVTEPPIFLSDASHAKTVVAMGSRIGLVLTMRGNTQVG